MQSQIESKQQSVLVIDDEEDLLELVRYNLEKVGYLVHCAKSGEEGLRVARDKDPNLVVLDLMLPGVRGTDVCKMLREEPPTSNTPIIMLTAKGEENDIVQGLEAGADDYITKPFSTKVLLSRVKAVLRRLKTQGVDDDKVVRIHDFVIDPKRHEVLINNSAFNLTATEFKLLHFLARRAGWVFTRYQIVDGVKGVDYSVTERAVDVQIVGLRKKLGTYGEFIETVRGVGYRFRE